MTTHPRSDFARSAPYWLRRVGVVGWLFLGLVFAAGVILSAVATLNSIVTPLLVAVVIGIVFRPVVDLLERRGVSRTIGTVLTLLLVLLGTVALIVIVVRGIIDQGPEILRQLEAGWADLRAWLLQLPIRPETLDAIRALANDSLSTLLQGIIGLLSISLLSVVGLLIGAYFALFILFFILRDGPVLEAWLARQFSLNLETSTAIVADASRSIRLYFQGTALTAVITAAVVAVPLIILDVPLVGSILVLYFFTSFIPYLGAYIAGAFAVIIAFSSGGPEAALIIALAVTVSNGVLQSAVTSWALGASLDLHPLVVFLVTLAAGVVGGVMLMVLAVPLTALALQTTTRLREEGVFSEDSLLQRESISSVDE